MSNSTVSEVLSQMTALVAEAVFQNVMPVLSAADTNVQANPQLILNPLNAGIFGMQLYANLQAAIPATENAAVVDVAEFAQAAFTALNAKVAALAATATPATIAAEITGSGSNAPVGIKAS